MMLGMCPTLAVTSSAINGLGMGVSTAAVLVCANVAISLIRKIVPDQVRIPAFVVVIASFVTIVDFLLQAYAPSSLYNALGLYIPLIVVNCIILGRAEAFASKNSAIHSFFDGVGQGLGFTIALCVLGLVREFIGSGTAFGMRVLPEAFPQTLLLIMSPGAFFTLGLLMALFNYVKNKNKKA